VLLALAFVISAARAGIALAIGAGAGVLTVITAWRDNAPRRSRAFLRQAEWKALSRRQSNHQRRPARGVVRSTPLSDGDRTTEVQLRDGRAVTIDARGVDAVIASGMPTEYGEMLTLLTETVASGNGSRPNHDAEAVTGAPPTNFAEFAQRTTSAWAVEVAR
jgi:hypothetical protein